MPVGYGDIIFFALVAVFLAFKFFSVLGKKEGDEDIERLKNFGSKPTMPEIKTTTSSPASIDLKQFKTNDLQEIKDPYDGVAFANDAVKDGVMEIAAKDTSFNIQNFLLGAKAAFEMVLKAYSENDRATLKTLLDDKLYANFILKIEAFLARNQKDSISLVSLKVVEVSKAILFNNVAKISLKLQSEQINFTKDESGNVVLGSTSAIDIVDDEWEFERNIRSSSPNWLITSL